VLPKSPKTVSLAGSVPGAEDIDLSYKAARDFAGKKSSLNLKSRDAVGAVHWIYRPLRMQLGADGVDFIHKSRMGHSSLTWPKDANVSFFTIDRSCVGRKADELVRARAAELAGNTEASQVPMDTCWRVDPARPQNELVAQVNAATTLAGLRAALGAFDARNWQFPVAG